VRYTTRILATLCGVFGLAIGIWGIATTFTSVKLYLFLGSIAGTVILLLAARAMDRKVKVKPVGTSFIDFGILAQKIVAEKEEQGFIPKDLCDEAKAEIIKDYTERLESVFNRILGEELERLGKAEEFERVLKTSKSIDDIVLYLRRTIPHYATFLHHTMVKVKKEVRGFL
jgi:uncharacterized membrane protein YeaQ/YmgE (transglycosylase-associated protein family)